MKSVAFLQEECIFQVDLLHIYYEIFCQLFCSCWSGWYKRIKSLLNICIYVCLYICYFASAGLGGMNGYIYLCLFIYSVLSLLKNINTEKL